MISISFVIDNNIIHTQKNIQTYKIKLRKIFWSSTKNVQGRKTLEGQLKKLGGVPNSDIIMCELNCI